MLLGKKKKIKSEILQKADGERSAFDLLMLEHLEGAFKNKLSDMGILKISIHIDWLDDIKCLGVQGYCKAYIMDLHIYPDEFCLAFDEDEPDEGNMYPLESRERFYQVLTDSINALA